MAGAAAVVREAFARLHPASPAPRVFRAPGRVNLIGEHTDYNLGFVLPVAIELACYAAVSPGEAGRLHVHSENMGESRSWTIAELSGLKPSGDWSDYVAGVARELLRAGVPLEGGNLVIHSTVPAGSGLSSSAAIEVSTGLALLGGRGFARKELALLCQRAEREFVGTPCGIMDQYVSLFGEENAAVKIDCRSLTHELASLPDGVKIIAVNSMVKHNLGSSAYVDRVRECGEAVRVLQMRRPEIGSLRDVSIEELDRARRSLSEIAYRRARHVIAENARVERFMRASADADLRGMGDLFVASHRSLQHDYQVSCEELDFLVDRAIRLEGVFGARMTGGGFGGCTVNLVDPEKAPEFRHRLADQYRTRFQLDPAIYECRPARGAEELV